MEKNPLLTIRSLGQDIWLDYISRGFIDSGGLKRLIDEDGLCGVTSNPAIFDKAIAGSSDYDSDVAALARAGKSIEEIYEALAIADIRRAADLFRPTFDRLEGADGFVSLEVNPHLARDTAGTNAEARHLWAALDRPNVFIKVPATMEGLESIRQLISEGINVNVTLLFSLPRYRAVADAYLSGLEARAAKGLPLAQVASVASFFLSRIDVLIDPKLQQIRKEGGARGESASELLGQIAIASARIAYEIYKEVFGSERFKKLAACGARPQRVLWASTSTKNPDYPDVKYVEPLIGPQTVNTLPLETLEAYRDHGHPALRLEEGIAEAHQRLEQLGRLGIDLDAMTEQLEEEGIDKFNKPFDSLMEHLEKKRAAALA